MSFGQRKIHQTATVPKLSKRRLLKILKERLKNAKNQRSSYLALLDQCPIEYKPMMEALEFAARWDATALELTYIIRIVIQL